MQLTIAERVDLLQLTRQTHSLWSGGLTKADYRDLFWSTCYQAWSRRNIRRLVYKYEEEITSSCKVVNLSFFMKGKYYNFFGLAALYTAADWRGQNLATNLIEDVIKQAKERNIDGILLLSAIDTDFYAACGFENLGSLDCELYPQRYLIDAAIYPKDVSLEIRSAETLFEQDKREKLDKQSPRFHFSCFEPLVTESEITELVHCHKRWLVRQPYGFVRDDNYFSFQLAKFLYFANYTKNYKASLFLTILREKETITGYAITECSGTTMRILELIGDDMARAFLWQSIIAQSKKLNLMTISGYEAIARDFVPSCRLDSILLRIKPLIRPSHIRCYRRFWSQPMLLPINEEVRVITNYSPCPLLEFDYF